MTDDSARQAGWPQKVVVLVALTLGVLGLAEFGAYAPAAIRKILLFSIAFGASTGLIVSLAAKTARIPRGIALPHTALLVLLGLSVITMRSHQRLRQALAKENQEHPQGMFDAALAEQLAADDPELARSLEHRRRTRSLEFTDYLAIRVQPLGEWKAPWPSVFWGAELLLATLAGVFVVHRRLTPTEQETVNAT